MQIATADEFVEAVRGAVKDPPKAYAEIIKVNLGASASEEKISEWELGKNQCAASARRPRGRRIPTTAGAPPIGKERPRWPSRSST